MSCIDQQLRNPEEHAGLHHRPVTGIYPVTESIALPPDARDCIMSMFDRPPCPNCKATTKLARITPGLTGFHIRTFECPVCDDIHQLVVDLVDPMKSLKAAGWLKSELRAPT